VSTLQRLADRGLVRPPRWLPAKVQYETIMGSVAYGVSSDTSDVDVYGWAIPPRDNVFPFGIVKFFQLAMENNLQRDNDRLKAIRRGE
jgi:predicted nucleotidyltransferase